MNHFMVTSIIIESWSTCYNSFGQVSVIHSVLIITAWVLSNSLITLCSQISYDYAPYCEKLIKHHTNSIQSLFHSSTWPKVNDINSHYVVYSTFLPSLLPTYNIPTSGKLWIWTDFHTTIEQNISLTYILTVEGVQTTIQEHLDQYKMLRMNVGSILNPATSCSDIPQITPSGEYWIQNGDNSSVQVYCDNTRLHIL